ncbi:MAG: transcriptional regulator [Planctomycetaceae bacterium]|nr:MAG: transcriptional regulator [Planctomycetaceae bacterium]
MHPSSRPVEPTAEPIPAELRELAGLIGHLPARYRDHLLPAIDRAIDAGIRRRRILNLVQEALAQLRLDMKYLIFDLEATRRERDRYKAMLDEPRD